MSHLFLLFVTTSQLRNTVLYLLWPTVVSLLAVDGCNNYTVLSEADRAQGHIVIDNNYRCDRDDLVPGWYRFQGAAGHRMCPTYVHTYVHTYYFGPTVSEGVVSRLVCYPHNHYYWQQNQSSNCCFFSNNIRVRNCGAFVVYELQKPPDCNLRYCGNGNAGKL